MRSFRLSGIDHAPFEPLFALTDAELAERGSLAVRQVADADFGFPCRVSLEDATPGEELLLLPFEHLPVRSPYRASGPIYVRRQAKRKVLGVGEMPPYITRRLISVRAYDADDMMTEAAVCDGPKVAEEITRLFANERVAYIHLHNAKPGCFACRVDRA